MTRSTRLVCHNVVLPMSLAILPKRADGRAISDLPVYFAVGLEAGAVIALQIAIMRIFSIGSWAHFGSLVVSLAMLGFGLMSTIMCIAKDWFARHWRAASAGWRSLSFGPLAVGRQSARPTGSLQRHLSRLRPQPEMAAARQFPALLHAFPRRRGFPRQRVLEGADAVQPGLFRRSPGLRPVRARRAAGHVCFRAAGPDSRAADPVAHGGWLLVHGRRGAARADRPHCRGRRRFRCASLACTGARSLEALRLRLQGRRLCAEIPRFAARLCEELAVRLSRNLCELLSAFRAGSFRQRRLQPEELPRQCL